MTAMTALSIGKGITLNSAEELEATLRHIGARRDHNLHPFHRLLHGGKLNKDQVRAWALIRYFYQASIPVKDASLISRFRDLRPGSMRHRIEHHDGERTGEGGIERWLSLTEGFMLDSAYVESTEGIFPATRFAVEAYVHFVPRARRRWKRSPPRSPNCSRRTCIPTNASPGMLQHTIPSIPRSLPYSGRRLTQAPCYADFALDYVKRHATTPAEPRRPGPR